MARGGRFPVNMAIKVPLNWAVGMAAKGVVALAVLSAPALAQQDPRIIRSPILTIDSERLYSGSAYGLRVQQNFQADVAVLEVENRRIEGELLAEESALTKLRAKISADEFRPKADAFDLKVQAIRTEQRDKLVALNQHKEDARRDFLTVVTPVLEEIMATAGAAVIVESRTVFMSARAIDVTQQAIVGVDSRIGTGNLAGDPAKEQP